MTNTSAIKLTFYLALGFIVFCAVFSFAHNPVTYEGMACELIEGNGTQGLQCEDSQGAGMSLPCGGEFEGLCDQARDKRGTDSNLRTAPKNITCDETDGGLACLDHQTGFEFSATCDMYPQFCQDSPTQAIATSNPQDSQWVTLGDPEIPQTNQRKKEGSQVNVQLDPSLAQNETWGNQSEEGLREANDTLNDFVRENGPALSARTKSYIRAVRASIHHALAHSVSRKVIGRLPEKYFLKDGIFERPTVSTEGELVASDAQAQMVRDVSLWEECQGVTHVDMISQCGGTPFGEVRLFRY